MHRLLKSVIMLAGLALTLPALAWTNVTVKQGDTLSAMAAKYRPAGISQADMMTAMRNINPAIVTRGFQAGMRLRIPTTAADIRESLASTSKPQALPVKKPAGSVKTQTAAASPTLKAPVAKSPAAKSLPPAAAPADNNEIAGYQATISKLQQALNNQSQMLQSDQEQIAGLTKQLSAENPPGSNAKPSGHWPFSSLWFVLWLITFILYLRARKKISSVSETAPPKQQPEIEPTLAHERKEQEPALPSINQIAQPSSSQRTKIAESRQHEENSEESWRQVELDIPAADAPPSHSRLDPTFNFESQQELAGEQQSIIREIANDHDNIDWHIALLEFYVKTGNQGGFTRHMQAMSRTGLMTDGDLLWERVRKMYLNGWIYNEET